MAQTEMGRPGSPSTLVRLSTPSNSPDQAPLETTVTLNVQQFVDAVKAVAVALRIDPTIPSLDIATPHTPDLPTSPSTVFSSAETASIAPCSTTPCHLCSMDTSSSRVVFVQLVQEFLAVLKSLSTKQEPLPPPAVADKAKSEQPLAQASKLEFKSVDEVWDAKACKYKIVESVTPPDEVKELDQYIFVVRTRIDKKTENPTRYIDIKSEGLREILRSVLEEVRGICLREEKPSVEQNLLFQYLSDLKAFRKNHVAFDDLKLQHLDLLLIFLQETYQSTTQRLNALLEKHEITYDLLWALFRPNMIVYTTCFGTGQPRCVKYEVGEEKMSKRGIEYFHVKARYLDFDGELFGETSSEHAIKKFHGAKRVTALEAFPLTYHRGEKDARAHLTNCGRKFLSMMDIHLRQYSGPAFYIEKDHVVEIFVKSRVVIDAIYFREENPNYTRPSIKGSDNDSSNGWIFISFDEGPEKASSLSKSSGMDPSEVKGDDLLICSPTVPGFSLGNNIWVQLAVATIKEIDWKRAALDDLHIPAKKKKAVQALSEAYVKRASTGSFDDFVKGKGQGFNVLLHGPTGVGKTLTAEVVAEHLQKALISVSAGELGTTAEAVEMRLPHIFQRAARWKAVLLLDEAEVFLEQRSIQDLYRNALVCVFLRTLEYYQGMMFLTTNRVRQIDEAIASRIHFKLKYGILNLEQRTNVWRRFLEKATTPQGPPICSRATFGSLVGKERNGREIKNLVSTAHALATQEGCQMTISHLEVALAACDDFEDDFKGVGSKEALNGYF